MNCPDCFAELHAEGNWILSCTCQGYKRLYTASYIEGFWNGYKRQLGLCEKCGGDLGCAEALCCNCGRRVYY